MLVAMAPRDCSTARKLDLTAAEPGQRERDPDDSETFNGGSRAVVQTREPWLGRESSVQVSWMPSRAWRLNTGAALATVKRYSHVPPHDRMLPSDENSTAVHYTGITVPAGIRGAEETKLANPPELLKLEK